jgi:hypothetical protein
MLHLTFRVALLWLLLAEWEWEMANTESTNYEEVILVLATCSRRNASLSVFTSFRAMIAVPILSVMATWNSATVCRIPWKAVCHILDNTTLEGISQFDVFHSLGHISLLKSFGTESVLTLRGFRMEVHDFSTSSTLTYKCNSTTTYSNDHDHLKGRQYDPFNQ